MVPCREWPGDADYTISNCPSKVARSFLYMAGMHDRVCVRDGVLKNRRQINLLFWSGNPALIVSGLCISVFLAWQILSSANFLYPVLHDVIGIQETIAEYAPKNIYKKSFDQTSREQRADLFRQIVYGINHNGKGLELIRYSNARGEPLGLFLRPPEVTHLKDVAGLLHSLRWIAGIAALVYPVILILFCAVRLNIPKPRHLLAGMVITLLVTILMISLSGIEDTFYHWHTLVFPQGHQWFFYYEESLMTMLMKAPIIFAWIAAMLLMLTLMIVYLLLLMTRALLGHCSKRPAVT